MIDYNLPTRSRIPKVIVEYALCGHCKAHTILEGETLTCLLCGRSMAPRPESLSLLHYHVKGKVYERDPVDTHGRRPYSMANRPKGRPRKDRTPAYIIERRIAAINDNTEGVEASA